MSGNCALQNFLALRNFCEILCNQIIEMSGNCALRNFLELCVSSARCSKYLIADLCICVRNMFEISDSREKNRRGRSIEQKKDMYIERKICS